VIIIPHVAEGVIAITIVRFFAITIANVAITCSPPLLP
jgi:hypothetical protein